jgi:hypothetical protein
VGAFTILTAPNAASLKVLLATSPTEPGICTEVRLLHFSKALRPSCAPYQYVDTGQPGSLKSLIFYVATPAGMTTLFKAVCLKIPWANGFDMIGMVTEAATLPWGR